MFQFKKNIQVPVVVTTYKGGKCDIYIPDLNMTVHGIDYVDAQANAILKCSAIYYYNLERNVKFSFDTTYADAEKMCINDNQFATFVSITE